MTVSRPPAVLTVFDLEFTASPELAKGISRYIIDNDIIMARPSRLKP